MLSNDSKQFTQILNTVNQWMVLMVPWIAWQVSFVLSRNMHFFHLIIFVTLSRIFDLPRHWAFQQRMQSAAVGTLTIKPMSLNALALVGTFARVP